MARVDPAYRNAVGLAVQAFVAHPRATLTAGPTFSDDGAVAQVTIDLGFGNRWIAAGESPWGVRPQEAVELWFPQSYPLRPASLSLRPDFSRNHPHIMPGLFRGRVVPCVIDGLVGEFVTMAGFEGLADQIFAWLLSASEGMLIDGAPGWEPARRDEVSDLLSADQDALKDVADAKGGFRFFGTNYFSRWNVFGLGEDFYADLGAPTTVDAKLTEVKHGAIPRFVQGTGLAVAVWAGSDGDGQPQICDQYVPDDVRTVGDLWTRAREFGMEASLTKAVALVRSQVATRSRGETPLVVLLLVRRPRDLVGTESPIEILAYLVPCRHPGGILGSEAEPVRPVGVLASLSDRVLSRLSGAGPLPTWGLLGAGSLGSKIALHLARQASPPVMVADKGSLTPHNAARHGLYPGGGDLDWMGPKADVLAAALKGLGANAKALKIDHLKMGDAMKDLGVKKRPQWLVNTTASLAVREALANRTFSKLPRQVEMSLYRAGAIGYMAVEGESRNPNTLELACCLYQEAADDAALGAKLFTDDGLSRVETGQGCGSMTMVMTDARLSTQAALLAEAFVTLPKDSAGSVRLFERSDDLGVTVRTRRERAFRRVAINGMPGWTLSISLSVNDEIEAEVARWPDVETGGVLIGRASLQAQMIVVTAIEPAPPDSVRRATLFELGVEGLSQALNARRQASAKLLDAVGTWHSHLGSARPSNMDRATAAVVGAAASRPMAFLIAGTDGYSAITASPINIGTE